MDITTRVVLASGEHPASAAAKLQEVVSNILDDLRADGQIPRNASEGSLEKSLVDEEREGLRNKVIRHITVERKHADIHPKALEAMPSPTLSFLIDAPDCIHDGALYCRFDGEAVDNLASHVRVRYGLEWEEYLVLAELPSAFPRTPSGIVRAGKRPVKRSAKKAERVNGRPVGYHADWIRRKRERLKKEAKESGAEQVLRG
jgi:hypothetical protein